MFKSEKDAEEWMSSRAKVRCSVKAWSCIRAWGLLDPSQPFLLDKPSSP